MKSKKEIELLKRNWSQTYYLDRTCEQHKENNKWFKTLLTSAKTVCIPELGLCWNKEMNITLMEKYGYADTLTREIKNRRQALLELNEINIQY